jgi:hypothetical protein
MAAVGRLLLYAMTGVVGPVYASKRLFTRLDFQSDKGLESALVPNACVQRRQNREAGLTSDWNALSCASTFITQTTTKLF